MNTKTKFSKQILSILLCLAMLMSYVPMTAYAALDTTATGGCNSDHTGYTVLNASNCEISAAGNYYLNSNLYGFGYNPTILIKCSGTVTLCLNGHNLYHTANGQTVIEIEATGGSLTVNLCDCQGTGQIYCTDSARYGIGLTGNSGNNILNMYGGTIRDCVYGVWADENSTLNLYGGTIQNSTRGINAPQKTSKVNIYGGTIKNNSYGIYIRYPNVLTVTGTPTFSENASGDLFLDWVNSIQRSPFTVNSPLTVSRPITVAIKTDENCKIADVDSATLLNCFTLINGKTLIYNDGQIFAHVSHSYSAATCVSPKTCTTCGDKEGTVDSSAHNWSNKDGICANGCGETCDHNGATSGTCGICGKSLHTHSYVYSKRGTIVTETCANNCGHSATATLSAENQTYTGSAIATATITYSDNWVGREHTEIDYTNNTNVGVATASITVEGQTLSTTFQITAASIAAATVTLNPESGTYTGTTYEPSISIVWNGITLAEGVDYTFGWYNAGLTEVGDYIVNIYGEGNFAGSTTKTFTVNAASLSDITVGQVGTLTYTGEAQTPTVSTSATAVNGQTVTFTYLYEEDGESYDAGRGESYGALPQFTEAGTYTVKYEASAPNHKSSCGEFTVTVEKAVVIEPDLGSVPYNGEVQRADIEDNDIYRITHQRVGAVPLKYNHTLKLNDPENYKWSTTDDAEVTVYFEITKAENAWITEPSISGWTYGETANAPTYEAKFGEVTVVYTGTANDGTAYNSETAPTKAGSYVATFTVEDEWRFSGLAATVDFTIAKADYDMSFAKWDYTDAFKYDGKEHKVEVVGLPTGVAVSGYEGNTAAVVGDYTAEVTFVYDADNYNAPSIADLNWKIENAWTPSEYTTSGDGWLNSDFVITANDGYKVSFTNTADGEWSDTLTGAVEGENSITFYVKNETTGAISLVKTVSYKLDKNTEATGTTGKVCFDERNGWEEFVNTITFGLFYKDEVTVKVDAEDKLSGVAKIEYFAADKAMTFEEVKAITTWTAYENGIAVTVEDAKQFVYFVRITDNAGNVTYLSTDGAEYDTTAPAISGIENGKTYYTTQKVTVTDKNIESITLNGEAAAESITLEGNKEATYTIVATDKAGNSTTVTVTMKPIADVDTTIDGITEDDVTSDDKETVQDVIDEIDELLKDEDLTDDEKAALEEIKDNAEKLIDKIEEADAADETENIKKVEDVTAENVTPEDKTDLENAKSDLEKALEDYGGNYTDDEKKAIEDEIDRIDDALEVIENVEAVEELIDKLPDTITKNDEAAIKAADDAYNALTDYEKSLVDDDAKKALDDAKSALAELKKPTTPDSPQTGDNSDLWLWFALLFVSGTGIFAITVYDRKRKAVSK